MSAGHLAWVGSLQAGIPVEALLGRYPGLRSQTEAVLDLIYQEVCLRDRHGVAARLDEYAWRFPDWAPVLGDTFAVHRVLESGRHLATVDSG